MTTTQKPRAFYTALGGEVACAEHIGMEAQALLARQPLARTIETSMTVWERMTREELADWMTFLAEHDETEACETCRAGW